MIIGNPLIIGSGSAPTPPPTPPSSGGTDVNFIDYDGTVLYSYSAAEFAELVALPANPSHAGLTAQGWNWTLADAKTHVARHGKLRIGQNYITDDGKTRIYIQLQEGCTTPMLCLYLYKNATVVVDWGDGTATETMTNSGSSATPKWTNAHNYAAAGEYVITLEVISGTVQLYGKSGGSSYLLHYNTTSDTRNYRYQRAIRRVEIGANMGFFGYSFAQCSLLTSVTMPADLDIGTGGYLFRDCLFLTGLVFPPGTTRISMYTMNSCKSLQSVSFPNGLTEIGQQAFQLCSRLQEITLPDSVATIAASAFASCQNLVEVSLPSALTSLPNNAFQSCSNLRQITFPDGLTEIGNSVLQGCANLEKITLPPNITKIGEQVFQNTGLQGKITIPSGVTELGGYCFYGCAALTDVIIPDGVTSIGNYMFYQCNGITDAIIPDGVTSIGNYAFYQCNGITDVIIPDGVTSIGNYAFYQMYSLCHITIPASVVSIGIQAFNSAVSMAEIHFKGATPPAVANANAFGVLPLDCKIYVPAGSLEAYTSATNYPSSSKYTYIEEQP